MDCSVHQRIKPIIGDTADKQAIHDPPNETPSTRNPYDIIGQTENILEVRNHLRSQCHPDVTLCSSTDHLDDSTDKAPSASATSAGSHDRPAQVLLNLSTRRERFGTV